MKKIQNNKNKTLGIWLIIIGVISGASVVIHFFDNNIIEFDLSHLDEIHCVLDLVWYGFLALLCFLLSYTGILIIKNKKVPLVLKESITLSLLLSIVISYIPVYTGSTSYITIAPHTTNCTTDEDTDESRSEINSKELSNLINEVQYNGLQKSIISSIITSIAVASGTILYFNNKK